MAQDPYARRHGLPSAGTPRVSPVPGASLHASHALRWTPADPRDAHPSASSVLAAGALTPSPSAFTYFTRLSQALGSAASPAGSVVPCVRFTCVVRLLHRCFLHSCHTRSEWLVGPSSARTCTWQEAPSFAWRTNAPAHRELPHRDFSDLAEPHRGSDAVARRVRRVNLPPLLVPPC